MLDTLHVRKIIMTENIHALRQGYLPFAVSTDFKAEYLRLVMQQGGTAARAYKMLSFDLLDLGPHMSMLDVGCGLGIDLPFLADLVGPQGEVVGLEHDPELVQAALETLAADGRPNIHIVQGDAEQMPFTDAQYDRVRADRAVQHMHQPERAIAEMWRVLRSGGMLTIVEPDWATMIVYPGSLSGGDDDSTLSSVLRCHQQHLSHPLMGRQLHALLHRQLGAWEQIQVQVACFTHTSWPVVDAILQISTAARALIQENPVLKDEIEAWLQRVEEAARRGEFFASAPLFFASAHKIGNSDG
jgi:ubiquinone/menaquinone biosynthesis C-methylase UbiE